MGGCFGGQVVTQEEQEIGFNAKCATIHFELADEYENFFNDPDSARKEYEKALKFDPSKTDTHLRLGNLLLRAYDDHEAARKCVEDALKINPENSSAHVDLGEILYIYFEDYDGAIQQFETAAQLDPKNVQCHYHHGLLLKDYLQEPDQAKKEFITAYKVNRNHPGTVQALGELARDMKNFGAALGYFQSAVTSDPINPFYQICLGNLQRDHFSDYNAALVRYDRAIELFEEFHGLKLTHSEYYSMRQLHIAALLEKGSLLEKHMLNFKGARECYEKVLEMEAENQEAKDGINSLLKTMKKQLKVSPNDVDALYHTGSMLRKHRNDIKKALPKLKKTVKVSPEHEQAHRELSELYRKELNDPNKERKHLEILCKLDADNMEYVKDLAWLLSKHYQEVGPAIKMLEEALRLHPGEDANGKEVLHKIKKENNWKEDT